MRQNLRDKTRNVGLRRAAERQKFRGAAQITRGGPDAAAARFHFAAYKRKSARAVLAGSEYNGKRKAESSKSAAQPSSAAARSARMSSMCSVPMERRIVFGRMPLPASSSGVIWPCVVLAG